MMIKEKIKNSMLSFSRKRKLLILILLILLIINITLCICLIQQTSHQSADSLQDYATQYAIVKYSDVRDIIENYITFESSGDAELLVIVPPLYCSDCIIQAMTMVNSVVSQYTLCVPTYWDDIGIERQHCIEIVRYLAQDSYSSILYYPNIILAIYENGTVVDYYLVTKEALDAIELFVLTHMPQ